VGRILACSVRLSTILCLLSLILCLGTGVLWQRSYRWYMRVLYFKADSSTLELRFDLGGLYPTAAEAKHDVRRGCSDSARVNFMSFPLGRGVGISTFEPSLRLKKSGRKGSRSSSA